MSAYNKLPRGITVFVTDELGRRTRAAGLARWLARTAPARARGIVTVALVSDARIRSLNRKYRGKNRATDVLSFPAPSLQPPASSLCLGDIVIARGVAKRQAREAGHPEPVELRVLALHGLLHLLGYDHEHDNGEMARLEQRLRRKGGLHESLSERAQQQGRPVLDTPERHGARVSGAGVGPRASKQ